MLKTKLLKSVQVIGIRNKNKYTNDSFERRMTSEIVFQNQQENSSIKAERTFHVQLLLKATTESNSNNCVVYNNTNTIHVPLN